jgi:hypothetical protein
MTTRRGRFLFAAVLLLSASCGGSSNPAPAPTPTTTSLTVGSTSSQLFLGASEVFSATATLSNGATAQVNGAVWSSDAPNVAQVDSATGRVTGASSGNANISVDYQGKRGTKAIRVVPNYTGNWTGSYTIASCTDTLQFQTTGFCSAVFPASQVLSLVLLLTQSGSTVSGSAALGQILSNSTSAPVQTDGSVLLPAVALFGNTTFTETWSLNIQQPGRIVGTLHVVITDTIVTGGATMDATLNSTTIQSLARVFGIDRAQPSNTSFNVQTLAGLVGRCERGC